MWSPGSLKCVFYAKFHKTQGPVIIYEAPSSSGFISEEVFKTAFEYICPKQELADKLVKFTHDDVKIVGCPVWLNSTVKYQDDRSVLRFNVCFVFSYHEDVTLYESCIRKISTSLKRLEEDSNYITNHETEIENVINKIYHDLNNKGVCNLELAGDTLISLQVNPRPADQVPTIGRCQVPVLLVGLEHLKNYRWDLMSAKLLRVVDGVKTVQQLIDDCDADADLTICCIRNLIYLKVLTLVPCFRLSNVYLLTATFAKFQTDFNLQNECMNFVKKLNVLATTNEQLTGNVSSSANEDSVSCDSSSSDASSNSAASVFPTTYPSLLSVDLLFNLYSLLSNGLSLQTVMSVVEGAGVDLRKLVQFGVIKGFLRRLHKYPYLNKRSFAGDSDSGGMDDMRRFFDGSHNTEELACRFNVPLERLEHLIESSQSIILYMR